jgi:hypothetical protein
MTAGRGGDATAEGGGWAEMTEEEESLSEWREAAGEFAWPETEDGEWDFLRPGR